MIGNLDLEPFDIFMNINYQLIIRRNTTPSKNTMKIRYSHNKQKDYYGALIISYDLQDYEFAAITRLLSYDKGFLNSQWN